MNTHIQQNIGGFNIDDIVRATLEKERLAEIEKKRKPLVKEEPKTESPVIDPTGDVLYYAIVKEERTISGVKKKSSIYQAKIPSLLATLEDLNSEDKNSIAEGLHIECKQGGFDTLVGVLDGTITALCVYKGKLYCGDDNGFVRDMPTGTSLTREYVHGTMKGHPINGFCSWEDNIVEETVLAIAGDWGDIHTVNGSMTRIEIRYDDLPITATCNDDKNRIYFGDNTGKIIMALPKESRDKMFTTMKTRDQRNERSIDTLTFQKENTLCYATGKDIIRLQYHPILGQGTELWGITTRPSNVRALCFYNGKLYDAGEYGKIYETETRTIFRSMPEGTIITAMCTGKVIP